MLTMCFLIVCSHYLDLALPDMACSGKIICFRIRKDKLCVSECACEAEAPVSDSNLALTRVELEKKRGHTL